MQLVVSGSQKNRPSRDFRTHAGAPYCEQIVPGETFLVSTMQNWISFKG